MDRKLDTTLCAAAFLAVFALFLWLSVPVVRRGLSSADDAMLAQAAKNIAVGKGYGTPQSSDTFVLFDHAAISTGPTLILPIAFLIWVFGPVDQLPGAATLVIFISQLVVAAIVLACRFGWTPTCGFLCAMLWLLMLASANNWYFGSFLGETVAFGYIFIGTALLALARRDRGIAAAALCFSFAYLTKQISLFAVAGIVSGWLVVSAFDRVGRAVLFRRVAILVLVGSSLLFAFEAAQLATLGPLKYRDALKANLNVTVHQAIGTGDQSARLTTFLTVLGQSYLSPALVIGLAMGSALLLVLLRRSRDEGRNSVGRFVAFTWAGTAVYLMYTLMLSILWQRYFWIGIAVMLTAITAPLLAVGSKLRTATIMVLLVGTVGFGLHRPLYVLHQWVSTTTAPIERAAVVRLLDNHPDLPYAAQYWSSIFDILYLRSNEGTWFCEPNVDRLQHREFIAVINHTFTDKKGRFFESVVATCELLTPNAGVIAAYRCGERFWATYP